MNNHSHNALQSSISDMMDQVRKLKNCPRVTKGLKDAAAVVRYNREQCTLQEELEKAHSRIMRLEEEVYHLTEELKSLRQ